MKQPRIGGGSNREIADEIIGSRPLKKPSQKMMINMNKKLGNIPTPFDKTNPCGEIFLPETTNNKELDVALKITSKLKESFPDLHNLPKLLQHHVKINKIEFSNGGINLETRLKDWFTYNKDVIVKDILAQELRKEVLPGITLNVLVEEELLKNA
jgi:hypothetical protein